MLRTRFTLYISGFSPILCLTLFLILFGASCNNGEKSPDVSGVKIELNTRRLDQDLAKMDTAQIAAGLQALSAKYPDFLDFWLDELMQFGVNGNYSDTAMGVREHLRQFLTYKGQDTKLGACQYYTVSVDGTDLPDRAWAYPEPYPTAIERVGKDFSGYVAFWKEVEVVD
jgi:hypothetical protein